MVRVEVGPVGAGVEEEEDEGVYGGCTDIETLMESVSEDIIGGS